MNNFGNQNAMTGQGMNQPMGQKQDPLDKVFDKVTKKSGHDMAPGTDEKITDAGRGLFEKVTG